MLQNWCRTLIKFKQELKICILFVTSTGSAISEAFGKRVVIDFQLRNLKVHYFISYWMALIKSNPIITPGMLDNLEYGISSPMPFKNETLQELVSYAL